MRGYSIHHRPAISKNGQGLIPLKVHPVLQFCGSFYHVFSYLIQIIQIVNLINLASFHRFLWSLVVFGCLSCLMLFKCCLDSGRPRLEWDRGWSVACRVDVWGWVNSGWNVNEIKQIKQVSSVNDKFILVKLSIDVMAVEVIWDFYS